MSSLPVILATPIADPAPASRECPKCNRPFKNLANKDACHDCAVAPGLHGRLKCFFCKEMFYLPVSLREHMVTHSAGSKPTSQRDTSRKPDVVAPVKASKPVVTLKLPTKPDAGLKRKADESCDEDGSDSDNDERGVQCAGCQRNYAYEFFLNKDSLCYQCCPKHDYGRVFKCLHCEETYVLPDSLNEHMKTHAVTCEQCGRTFTNPSGLEAHRRMMSRPKNTRNPYICSDCGRSFRMFSRLREHTLRCAETIVSCSVCFQGFANKVALLTHTRMMHKSKSG